MIACAGHWSAAGALRLLLVNDFAGLAALVEAFFASIPHQWYTNNDIASYEGFYASVFYSYFAGLGLDIAMEDSSDRGEPIHLIAVEFSREARNLAGFDVEQA